MMAGVLLVVLGATGMGSAVKFIPRPVVLGFTNGIAVLIASTQVVANGRPSSQNQPPPSAPASARASAATFHSKLNGNAAVSDEGGSYMVWNRPRPNTPE